MAVFQVELVDGFGDGVAHDKMTVEDGHHPCAVGAGFTVHEGGVFYAFEEIARAFEPGDAMHVAAIHTKINEADAVFFAGFAFQPVKAFRAFPAQVDDGLYPHLGELGHALCIWLHGAVHAAAYMMVVMEPKPQKSVIAPERFAICAFSVSPIVEI